MEERIGGMQAVDSIQNNQEKPANMKTYTNIGSKKVGNFEISKNMMNIIKNNKVAKGSKFWEDLWTWHPKDQSGGYTVIQFCLTNI